MFGTGLQDNEVVTASLTNVHSLCFFHHVGGTDYDSHQYHKAYREWRAYGVKLLGFGTINENRLQGYCKDRKAILRTIAITDKCIGLNAHKHRYMQDNNPVEESPTPSPTIAFWVFCQLTQTFPPEMEMKNTMHLLITSYLKAVAHQSCRGYQCVRSTCSVKKAPLRRSTLEKHTCSIASAAMLVVAQCVKVAEAMGTELEHLIVAVNMSSHDDKAAAY
nr:VAN3-binding protein [Tanacetum cinerariifolium]